MRSCILKHGLIKLHDYRYRVDTPPSTSTHGHVPGNNQEDMDDLIGLLNNGAPVSTPCRPISSVKEDLEHERRLREEQQRLIKRDEDNIKAAAAQRQIQQQQHEQQQQQQQQQQQALERARLGARMMSAALVIQSCVRVLLAKREATRRREERHRREVAAVLMQAAIKARAAREELHGLRVEDFRRRRAARKIATSYLWYRSQWHLNPVQGPKIGGSGRRFGLDSHAHLLEKPLRLRSMADTRLAPEVAHNCADGSEAHLLTIAPSDSGKRTMASARVRADQIMQDEGRQRDEVGARALMAVSEHRDLPTAMQVVKAGGSK